jgi:hypothetical protein
MRWLLASVLVMLLACDQKEQTPEGLLDREKFKEVLLEAQLLEARYNHEVVVEHKQEVPMKQYYEQVFEKHGTDREQFQRTFEYYTARPEELKAIYEEIMVELGRRKDGGM